MSSFCGNVFDVNHKKERMKKIGFILDVKAVGLIGCNEAGTELKDPAAVYSPSKAIRQAALTQLEKTSIIKKYFWTDNFII